ncbi:MAG: hypothetical protein RIF41_15040 [Polyangiaceae bacterium]
MPFRVWMLLALLAVNGCKDESDPVDIPFDGVDPGDVKDTRPKPVVEPTATASASAKPAPGPGNPAAARVQSCCGSLYALSKSAKDEGTRAVNKQAASVCSRLAAQVAQGKMSSNDALARVRSSLLGTPPGACR